MELQDSDQNKLRESEIRRLVTLAELAYKNSVDEGLKMKTREEWFGKYTNVVLALNQLLRDSKYKNYDERLRVLEESAHTSK